MNGPKEKVQRQLNIAMILTVARLILSPIFVFVFLVDNFWGAFACLIIAIISELTDLFDGMIARYRNEVTDFGKILDPLADSISRLTIFICLIQGGLAPIYLIVFILYRDSLIATLRTVCAYRSVVVSARWSGKTKAIFQATAILIILFLRMLQYRYPTLENTVLWISYTLIWIVTIVTVLSAVDYVTGNWKVLKTQLKLST